MERTDVSMTIQRCMVILTGAASQLGGGAGGEESEAAPEPDLEADSDGSSDSDASYKKAGYTGPMGR